MGTLFVDKLDPQSGTSLEIGSSGDTITIPSGATITNNGTASGFGGITQADLWRLNTTFTIPSTNTNTDLTSNWERADDATQSGYIGSGMSQSSGIFTFPETGIYQIRFNAFFTAASAHYVAVRIFGTPDNSAYDQLATAEQGLADTSGGTDYTNLNAACHFDCTNTSTHKVKFTVYTTASSTNVYAESTSNATYVTFLRLGDT